MTKVTVLDKAVGQKELKSIEFINHLTASYNVEETDDYPSLFQYVDLIALDYAKGYDLMLAYDDPMKKGCGTLMIGKFNDGVI